MAVQIQNYAVPNSATFLFQVVPNSTVTLPAVEPAPDAFATVSV